MIFDKFIKSVKDNIDSLSNKPDNNGVKQQVPSSIPIPVTPSNNAGLSASAFNYVHTAQNRDISVAKENDVIVLWWISKKKKGYDRTTNKYPKWFAQQYNINFNQVMDNYILQGCLSEDDNNVKITALGEDILKEFDYVIYIHEHPQYCLKITDFKNSPNLHKVQLADLAWGVFNNRILLYYQQLMWSSLAANYANMADLLVEEKKYNLALDYIYGVAYLETSGMLDNNELTTINAEFSKKGWNNKFLQNGLPDIFLLKINNYYVTVPFKKVQDNLNLNWDEIKRGFLSSELIRSIEGNIPFRYFEKEESFEIFKQAIEADGKKGIFSIKDCNKKLKWNKPDEHSSRYFYASVENKVNRKLKN